MVNVFGTSRWVIGSCSAAVVTVLLASEAMHASASTTVLFVALAIAPAIVTVLFADDATASTTVAQILHPQQPKDGRS